MRVLTLNAGSSTLKFALFDMGSGSELMRGVVDRLGSDAATLNFTEDGTDSSQTVGSMTLTSAVERVLDRAGTVDAVGCRVVHGGVKFNCATLVTPAVIETIRELAPLAPLHNARDLETIEAAKQKTNEIPVVAVFDTTFHRSLPAVASHYAIPKSLAAEKHVRRFGFHGISYRFISERMADEGGTDKGRLILCHLGSGASVCAVLDGQSVDTSMGMTPLEGLVMGTRSGDIDPGAVLYLLRETGTSLEDADRLLNHESGLLGLSGCSADVRTLEDLAAKGNPDAEFALDVFAYRVAKYVGAYSVVLGGLDALVFAGGIGENSADTRRRICGRLGSLGISDSIGMPGPDQATCISETQSPSVWVVRTDEEKQIAIETMDALAHANG